MATKAKNANPSTSDSTPESMLSEAINLMEAGKAEAVAAFKAVEEKAAALGKVSLARAARNYLAILDGRASQVKTGPIAPEVEATLLLNTHAPEEALPVLDAALAKQQDHAQLNYLRALALVQLGRYEDGAVALQKAIEGEQSFQWQYRLEPDFTPARRHPSFAELERA